MKTPKFFQSVEAYKAYRLAWAQRCHRREVLPFAMQLFHRFVRTCPMAPAVSKKTHACTVSGAFRSMTKSQYTSCLVTVQAWPEYDHWLNVEELKEELAQFQPNWDNIHIVWPQVEDLAALLNTQPLTTQE